MLPGYAVLVLIKKIVLDMVQKYTKKSTSQISDVAYLVQEHEDALEKISGLLASKDKYYQQSKNPYVKRELEQLSEYISTTKRILERQVSTYISLSDSYLYADKYAKAASYGIFKGNDLKTRAHFTGAMEDLNSCGKITEPDYDVQPLSWTTLEAQGAAKKMVVNRLFTELEKRCTREEMETLLLNSKTVQA